MIEISYIVIGLDEVVKVVSRTCDIKGSPSSDYGKENHSKGKDISLFTVVWPLFMDFRRGECWCATPLGQILVIVLDSQSKVYNFDVKVFINEHILKFQISMTYVKIMVEFH